MQTLKYIFLAALVFLIIKAFYLDEKIEEYKNESNQTEEQNETNGTDSVPEQPIESPVPSQKNNDSNTTQKHTSYKDAPIEKLGDAVADKLDEKIKIPDRQNPAGEMNSF